MKKIIVLLISSVCVMKSYAQTNAGKNNFKIEGNLPYRDTGSISIWYTDADNVLHRDTIALNQGKFSFSGTVNGATEALIWTTLRNIAYDHPSMFRFILTPGSVTIFKTSELENATINGSFAQVEKEQWDKFKLPLTTLEDHCSAIADSLRKIDRSTGQKLHKKLIDSLSRVFDSSRTVRKKLDIDYIAKHPGTYLSMYLLGYRCKAIPVDSVVKFFSGFPDSVTKSSLGNDVLTYIYPLTDNKAFRAKYPLYGMAFEKRLNKLRSMHDFKLTDIAGKEVNFKAFRGKYLVIDVWANWCKPCIANIPAWNALMKQYDPEVIRFVSIAVDEDVAAWKEIVAKHKPGGVQVIDPKAFAGLFAVYNRVVFVPKYLIVDPAGKIINNQAPHPGPELQKLLNSLIEKKN